MKATIRVALIATLLAASSDNYVNINNADRNARLQAIMASAVKGNGDAVDPLLKRLSIEKEREVRVAIVRGLQNIGDIRAAAPLRDRLSKHVAESNEIITALAGLGDRASLPLIRERYWHPSTSATAADALFRLGDGHYVSEANRWRRTLAVWIPLGFLLLFVAVAVAFSKDRQRASFRISLAAANGAVGFMLGFFLFFIGSILLAPSRTAVSPPEWAGIAYLATATTCGFFSGFFSALAPFVQIRNWRPVGNAFALSVAALLLSPVVLTSMTKVFALSNAPTGRIFADFAMPLQASSMILLSFLILVSMAALAVFISAWAVSLPLKRVECEPPFNARQFVLATLLIGVIFLLHDPIAQLIVILSS